MSYFELMGMVSELGYNNINKLYYMIPCRGFEIGHRLIVANKKIIEMLEDAKMTRSIELYVEHIDVENVGLEDNQGVEEIDGSNSGYEETDDESEVNSINYVSDDEELIEVRQKLRRLKKGNKLNILNLLNKMQLKPINHLYQMNPINYLNQMKPMQMNPMNSLNQM